MIQCPDVHKQDRCGLFYVVKKNREYGHFIQCLHRQLMFGKLFLAEYIVLEFGVWVGGGGAEEHAGMLRQSWHW